MPTQRIFLAVVGAAYVLLAAWCAVKPQQTSASLGYSLTNGSGRSEYFVIYGGLQAALGLMFLWPLWNPTVTAAALGACLILHGAIVVFRSTSFVLYGDVQTMTYMLAGGEWAILIGAAIVWWTGRN